MYIIKDIVKCMYFLYICILPVTSIYLYIASHQQSALCFYDLPSKAGVPRLRVQLSHILCTWKSNFSGQCAAESWDLLRKIQVLGGWTFSNCLRTIVISYNMLRLINWVIWYICKLICLVTGFFMTYNPI